MAEQNAANGQTPAGANQSVIDPLRRVLVPIEKRILNDEGELGDYVFRTSDGQKYRRNVNTGTIKSAVKKINGKEARKARARARKREEHANTR